jgi:AbrB family looped-hinge helix DNA binding protein
MHADAIVSSKGQITLPAKIRAQLGIQTGTKLHFELRGQEIIVTPQLPMKAYRGMLKGHKLKASDFDIPKDKDRTIE